MREAAASKAPGRTLRQSRGIEAAGFGALLLTALALVCQDELTSDTFRLAGRDADGQYQAYAYNDAMTGGHSAVRQIGPLSWSCQLHRDDHYPFCGFGLLFDSKQEGRGLDLSRYQTVRIGLRYEGRAEFLRVALKNHDRTRGAPNQVEATKFQQATVAVRAGDQDVRVRISDFVVAEWWKEEVKLPAELTRPDFSNVTAIEFITANSFLPGEHRLHIRDVTFEGRLISTDAYYGGIALCWMIFVGAFLAQRRRQEERWKRRWAERVLNSLPEVVWSVAPDGHPDFVSRQWSELYGGDPDMLIGRGWLRIMHPDDRRRTVESWKAAKHGGEPYEAAFRIRLPDGSYRWAVARARPHFGEGGGKPRWFGTCSDAHDRILAIEAVKTSERLHRGILEASADCICILAADGALELMNGPGQRAVELDSIDRLKGVHWSKLWERKTRPLVRGAILRASAGDTVRFRSSCPTAKGTLKWWDVVLTPMLDDGRSVRGILAICRDVTSDREKSEQLRWASEHDALTSLPNRRAFQARLQAATLRAMIAGEQVGLLLIDLDHFKHVNDSLGHAAGDELLDAIARRLGESVRDSDFVARVGGDEFAVILENVRSREDVLALARKLCGQIQLPIQLSHRTVSAGASIGGAMFPEDAQSSNDLFKNADIALYALKGSGRGGTMLFTADMMDEVEKASSQLGCARDALSEKSVLPVYQPKVEVQSGRIVGFEALLRWRHPMKGLQLPGTVEEAFKDYELAAKIGELMQRRVAQDVRSWTARGLAFGRVSLNAAPAEFLRDDYSERLLAVLEDQQVAPQQIEVEVTEHALLEQGPQYVARALTRLKAAGVTVSLDDFGTGYSSLSHLRDYPVDLVKIDMSFVQQMSDDPEIAAIVAAVVNLAGSLSIDVVAEGVETAGQRDLLRAMGCQFAQGHLFGKAVEAEEVVKLLSLSAVA